MTLMRRSKVQQRPAPPARSTGKRRPPRPGQTTPRKDASSGASAKLAISFTPDLAGDVRRAARRATDGNVSAWLAEAARQRLRHEALSEAIDTYEAEHGEITDEELAAIDKVWPRRG